MADNIQIDAGTGPAVAADDVSSVWYQRVKLVDGTADSTAVIPGDATNGLDVDVTRLIPGVTATALGKAEDAAHTDGDTGILLLGVRNYAGAGTDADYSALSVDSEGAAFVKPRSNLKRIAVSVGTVTTATTTYTAGDMLGAEMTFSNASRANGGFGWIVGAAVYEAVADTDVLGACDLVVYNASTTAPTDNAAYSISATDVAKIIAVIPLSGAYEFTNTRVAVAHNIRVPYETGSGTSLFVHLVTRSSHSFFKSTPCLTVVLHLELV